MAINIGKVTIGNLWKSHTEVFNLVVLHLNRYPEMEAQDVYTLIYQGAMGAAYFTDDGEVLEEQLMPEFAEVPPDEEQMLWETIRPDGELVRVHMAALKARGGQAQKLATLSLWTASIFTGDKGDLVNGWGTFQHLCTENRLRNFNQEDISTITVWAEANNFPSTRHSRAYRDAYDPHYRLMKREFLQMLLEQS